MYEYFDGKIVDFYDDFIIIDVAGIGYRLISPKNILSQVSIGENKVIYAEQVVSENSNSIYGFATKEDRKMFNLLRTVPKVGPKTAIGILGAISLSKLVSAILSSNKDVLKKLPGIGLKSAERLIIDLKDKVKEFGIQMEENEPITTFTGVKHEVIEALIQFGYNSYEIEKKLSKLDFNDLTIDQALKLALKNMN